MTVLRIVHGRAADADRRGVLGIDHQRRAGHFPLRWSASHTQCCAASSSVRDRGDPLPVAFSYPLSSSARRDRGARFSYRAAAPAPGPTRPRAHFIRTGRIRTDAPTHFSAGGGQFRIENQNVRAGRGRAACRWWRWQHVSTRQADLRSSGIHGSTRRRAPLRAPSLAILDTTPLASEPQCTPRLYRVL